MTSALTSIQFSQLTKFYARRLILDQVSLNLHPGCCQLLTGINGAGKTTLLRILSGLEKPQYASVNIGHGAQQWKNCRHALMQNIIYLHQQPYMFEGNVRHNLAYALPRKMPETQRKQRIEEALDWAGLKPLAHNLARTLSGGERQRVAIARAWLREPQVMLLDEPTANMDSDARQRTLILLNSLKQQGIALLIASHDPQHFYQLSDEWLCLDQGKVITCSAPESGRDKVTPLYIQQQARS